MDQIGKNKRIEICMTKLNNIVQRYNISEYEFNQIIQDKKSITRLDQGAIYAIRKNYHQIKTLSEKSSIGTGKNETKSRKA